MSKIELKPSSPFPNGTEYDIFLASFCERCKKHKANDIGMCAYVEEGGCPIENAMEDARFGHPFPSEDIVKIYEDGEIICWNACTKFECEDKELMRKYMVMMGETE